MAKLPESNEKPPASAPHPQEAEIAGLVEQFLAGYDIESDIGRFRAYRDAIAHAQENLLQHPFCNLFLDRVGRAVGREPAYLDNLKFRIALPEGARLDFCYEEDWGFVITGNADGLDYFSNLFSQLRSAPCALDHIHLPNDERPLGTRSYAVTIYKEADDWFERLDTAEEGDDDFEDLPKRNLEAGQVYALQFVQFPPPELPLTVNRIYRVRSMDPTGEEVPIPDSGEVVDFKPFEGRESRRFRFEFLGDTKRPVSLVLHLDDPGVNFFTKKDLMKVVIDAAS